MTVDDQAKNGQVQSNWIGVVFYVATDQFISMSMAQVMQIPNFRPVYIREQANKMYSPSSYFLSGFLITSFQLMFYPVLVGLITFWFIDFNDSSFGNLMSYVLVLFLVAFAGSAFGFMFGCLVDNEQQGVLVN